MKKRSGFVSNSSSSSFICITADNKIIYNGDGDSASFETDTMTLNIDKLIKELQEAKDNGAKNITIEYGGGYDG